MTRSVCTCCLRYDGLRMAVWVLFSGDLVGLGSPARKIARKGFSGSDQVQALGQECIQHGGAATGTGPARLEQGAMGKGWVLRKTSLWPQGLWLDSMWGRERAWGSESWCDSHSQHLAGYGVKNRAQVGRGDHRETPARWPRRPAGIGRVECWVCYLMRKRVIEQIHLKVTQRCKSTIHSIKTTYIYLL